MLFLSQQTLNIQDQNTQYNRMGPDMQNYTISKLSTTRTSTSTSTLVLVLILVLHKTVHMVTKCFSAPGQHVVHFSADTWCTRPKNTVQMVTKCFQLFNSSNSS